MKVTCVVVTYNRIELLKECLEALQNQDYEDMDILVVDNCSTDGTGEYLASVGNKAQTDAAPKKEKNSAESALEKEKNSAASALEKENVSCDGKIKYLTLPENIGGAGGFHEGMKAALEGGCEYMWLMDDDTIPEKEALSELIKATEVLKDEKFSYISSNVYGMDHECMNTPRMPFTQSGKNGYADWNRHLDEALVKVRSATFCACFVSAAAVREVGLPIKEYFIWGDDTEYTLRLSKYYGQAYLAGKSLVLHKRANNQALSIVKEDNPGRINMYYYYVRNYLINLKLYFGVIFAIGKILHFDLMILQILFGKSKYKGKKTGVLFRGIFAFIFGTYNRKAVKSRFTI